MNVAVVLSPFDFFIVFPLYSPARPATVSFDEWYADQCYITRNYNNLLVQVDTGIIQQPASVCT